MKDVPQLVLRIDDTINLSRVQLCNQLKNFSLIIANNICIIVNRAHLHIITLYNHSN